MRKVTKVKENLEDLAEYGDLREYLDKLIGNLLPKNTNRSNTELSKLKELRDILDLCAVLCNYSDKPVEPDDLYSLLS